MKKPYNNKPKKSNNKGFVFSISLNYFFFHFLIKHFFSINEKTVKKISKGLIREADMKLKKYGSFGGDVFC